MTNKCGKLLEDRHFRVLGLLQENPELSQGELAAAVGMSARGGPPSAQNALKETG